MPPQSSTHLDAAGDMTRQHIRGEQPEKFRLLRRSQANFFMAGALNPKALTRFRMSERDSNPRSGLPPQPTHSEGSEGYSCKEWNFVLCCVTIYSCSPASIVNASQACTMQPSHKESLWSRQMLGECRAMLVITGAGGGECAQ